MNYKLEGHKIEVLLDRVIREGESFTLEFDYFTRPLGWKCWVESSADGMIPGLGDGETELCFEGCWLPVAGINPVMAEVEIISDGTKRVLFNGELLKVVKKSNIEVYSFKTCMSTYPTIIAGDFELIERKMDDDCSIAFYHQREYSSAASKVVGISEVILRQLVEWFESNPIKDFYLVQLKRLEFGQYAPFPMVILPKDDIRNDMSEEQWQSVTGMLTHQMHEFFSVHMEGIAEYYWCDKQGIMIA